MKKSRAAERQRAKERGGIVCELYECTVPLIQTTAHREKLTHCCLLSRIKNQSGSRGLPLATLKTPTKQVSTVQAIFWAFARLFCVLTLIAMIYK